MPYYPLFCLVLLYHTPHILISMVTLCTHISALYLIAQCVTDLLLVAIQHFDFSYSRCPKYHHVSDLYLGLGLHCSLPTRSL